MKQNYHNNKEKGMFAKTYRGGRRRKTREQVPNLQEFEHLVHVIRELSHSLKLGAKSNSVKSTFPLSITRTSHCQSTLPIALRRMEGIIIN